MIPQPQPPPQHTAATSAASHGWLRRLVHFKIKKSQPKLTTGQPQIPHQTPNSEVHAKSLNTEVRPNTETRTQPSTEVLATNAERRHHRHHRHQHRSSAIPREALMSPTESPVHIKTSSYCTSAEKIREVGGGRVLSQFAMSKLYCIRLSLSLQMYVTVNIHVRYPNSFVLWHHLVYDVHS